MIPGLPFNGTIALTRRYLLLAIPEDPDGLLNLVAHDLRKNVARAASGIL